MKREYKTQNPIDPSGALNCRGKPKRVRGRQKGQGILDDIRGKEFHWLTAIEPTGEVSRKNAVWICRCRCGKEVRVKRSNLIRASQGKSAKKSCGCMIHKRGKGRAPGETAFIHFISTYKLKCKWDGIPFEISDEKCREIMTADCLYCGKPPEEKRPPKNSVGSCFANGIDRVDSSRGYHADNIVPCCTRCNRAKSNHSLDNFVDMAHKICSRESTIRAHIASLSANQSTEAQG